MSGAYSSEFVFCPNHASLLENADSIATSGDWYSIQIENARRSKLNFHVSTEFDIVLISFVNNRNPGFHGEPHRLCVALTCARYILGLHYSSALLENMPPSSALARFLTDLRFIWHLTLHFSVSASGIPIKSHSSLRSSLGTPLLPTSQSQIGASNTHTIP